MENNTKIKIGDYVKIGYKNGTIQECIITHDNLFGMPAGILCENHTPKKLPNGDYVRGLIFPSQFLWVKILSEAEEVSTDTGKIFLESISNDAKTSSDVTFYRTKLPKSEQYVTLCRGNDACEVAISVKSEKDHAMYESYVNSQLHKMDEEEDFKNIDFSKIRIAD